MANFLCPVQSTSVHLPQFYNLVETYELNSLSVRLQRSIWTPVMSFPNARQAEGTLVDGGSSTIVLKLGSPLGDKISRSTEAQIYEGVDCPLVMKREDPYRVSIDVGIMSYNKLQFFTFDFGSGSLHREYLVTFNCDFDLAMYPFDTQVCLMEFQTNGIPKRYLSIEIEAVSGSLLFRDGLASVLVLFIYKVSRTILEGAVYYIDVICCPAARGLS